MRSAKATALGLAAAVVAILGAGLPVPAAAQTAREVVQQQLKEQEARNEALKQRIEKLEAILKTDICANPEAAELLLKETQAPLPR